MGRLCCLFLTGSMFANLLAAIPTSTLPGGGKLPMLYSGDGNMTMWVQLVGKGAGVKTAWTYHNQPSILPQVYKAGLSREDVFLETMIPCGFVDHPSPMTESSADSYIKEDLALLNTSYVDLLLIHHRCNTPEETAEVWKALEAALKRGDTKAIGVSNFNVTDLTQLQAIAKEPISVNEAHFAVGVMDHDMIGFAKAHGIQLVSFSSLAAGVPMDNPVVTTVATQHNVSNAVVMLKYVSQHGISVLSSFTNPDHARDDIGIFDFELTPANMAALDSLQKGKRTCQDCFTHECQACAQALINLQCPVGEMPVPGRLNPDSAKCLSCAAQNNASVTKACGPQYMIEKACGQAGGFPRKETLKFV